jgi:hypothetical protein
MLFKSNVPMSHRVAFFLAGMVTIDPLHRLARGTGLTAFDLLPAAIGWSLVVYQWRERKTLKWQLRNAEGYGHHSALDLLQTKWEQLPAAVKVSYWLLVILAAFVIYWRV